MNTEVQSSSMDTVKLALALLLLCGGVIAFYWFADHSLLVRVLSLLAVTGLSIVIASLTARGRAILSFVGATRTEVRKVVWPTRAETVQTTLVILLVVVLMVMLLWTLDAVLLWAIQILTGQGG